MAEVDVDVGVGAREGDERGKVSSIGQLFGGLAEVQSWERRRSTAPAAATSAVPPPAPPAPLAVPAAGGG